MSSILILNSILDARSRGVTSFLIHSGHNLTFELEQAYFDLKEHNFLQRNIPFLYLSKTPGKQQLTIGP